MPTPIELSSIDGVRLEGIEFCRRVYQIFDEYRISSDYPRASRLRTHKSYNRFFDEALPLAAFIQLFHNHWRRVEVEWFSGYQSYDAKIFVRTKSFIEQTFYVELTAACHPDAWISRHELETQGFSWGPNRTVGPDGTVGPLCLDSYQRTNQWKSYLSRGISSKIAKDYPPNTILVLCFNPSGVIVLEEWEELIELMREDSAPPGFHAIYALSERLFELRQIC